jgi:anti-sigma regulatory factor (Ser/Thr protein kinase)
LSNGRRDVIERTMGRDEPLHLKLPAEPENVRVARDAVAERAERLGLQGRSIDDLKTVVSEVCTNAVLHAYPEGSGKRPMEIEMSREGDALCLAVRDHGIGIQPPKGARPDGLRMGLLLVGALASCFELRSSRGHGTEVLLRFPAGRTG